MAKGWQPPGVVGKSETIGRRLFDEPMLVGARGQPSYSGLLLRHFEETRGQEFSVDRLGATGVTKQVIQYLRPRAENAGKSFHEARAFNGWICARACVLEAGWKGHKYPVIASAIKDKPEPEDNVYHAHVLIGDDPYGEALYLKHIFTTKGGQIERVPSSDVLPWWRVLAQRLKACFVSLRSSLRNTISRS